MIIGGKRNVITKDKAENRLQRISNDIPEHIKYLKNGYSISDDMEMPDYNKEYSHNSMVFPYLGSMDVCIVLDGKKMVL